MNDRSGYPHYHTLVGMVVQGEVLSPMENPRMDAAAALVQRVFAQMPHCPP